jgi:predicted permease
MQFRNHPELPARAVLLSTLLSPATTPFVVWLVQTRLR